MSLLLPGQAPPWCARKGTDMDPLYVRTQAALADAQVALRRADSYLDQQTPDPRERECLVVQLQRAHQLLERVNLRLTVTDWDAELQALGGGNA